MGSSGGEHARKAQLIEVSQSFSRVQPINFIGYQIDLAVLLAQLLGDHIVRGDNPRTAVDNKQYDVRFIHGQQRLLGHAHINSLFLTANTTGVDDHKAAVIHLSIAIFTVAS